MMDLLEIDGKPAPGKKSLAQLTVDTQDGEEAEASPPSPPPEEPQTPQINAREVNEIAKFKSNRLRESIVLQAMSGPAPSGLDKKDRGGLDQLIFHAASAAKARFGGDEEEDDEERSTMTPVRAASTRRLATDLSRDSYHRSSVGGSGGGLSSQDLSAIRELTNTLKEVLVKYDAAEKKLQKVIDLYEKAEAKLPNGH